MFIGLESVNPENLAASRKQQNHVGEYRTMLQAWRSRGVLTQAGYIVGFPADTPESIERDIRTIQRELPVDILEFFMLTPLPGSADHRDLYLAGRWLEPDLNRYDTEHAAAKHPRMSAEEWKATYDRAWHLYYSPEHVADALAAGAGRRHPDQAPRGGDLHVLRQLPLREGPPAPGRRISAQGAWHAPAGNVHAEHPLLFYSRRAWEIVSTYARGALYYLWLNGYAERIERDPAAAAYTDAAIAGFDRGTVGGRHAKRLLDRDPIEAQDRAKRNEEALAVSGTSRPGESPGTRRHRTPLAIALCQTAIGRQNSNVEWGNEKSAFRIKNTSPLDRPRPR